MKSIHEQLVERYGFLMYVDDIAKELKLSVGTIRNRSYKKNLPFPVDSSGQRIKAKTADVAKYLEG